MHWFASHCQFLINFCAKTDYTKSTTMMRSGVTALTPCKCMRLIEGYGIKSLFEVPSTSWPSSSQMRLSLVGRQLSCSKLGGCISCLQDDRMTAMLWLCHSVVAALVYDGKRKTKAMSAP